MKKIIIIVGRSGAGKSTVAREYIRVHKYPLLTFREVGKKLAIKNGFSTLGAYFAGTDTYVFKNSLGGELVKEISDKMQIFDILVIDGLIFYDIVLSVKQNYENVLIVNIEVPYEIRIARIAEKLSATLYTARSNEKSKSELKAALGIEDVLRIADVTLDGRKPVKEIVEEMDEFVSQEGSYK